MREITISLKGKFGRFELVEWGSPASERCGQCRNWKPAASKSLTYDHARNSKSTNDAESRSVSGRDTVKSESVTMGTLASEFLGVCPTYELMLVCQWPDWNCVFSFQLNQFLEFPEKWFLSIAASKYPFSKETDHAPGRTQTPGPLVNAELM